MSADALRSALVAPASAGQLMFDVARAAGYGPRLVAAPSPPTEALADPALLEPWLEAVGEYFGVEVEPVETSFADVDALVARAAPCVLRIVDAEGRAALLGVVATTRRHVVALLPGLRRRRLRAADVAAALRAPIARELAPTVAGWTATLPLTERGRRRAHEALVAELANGKTVGGAYLLRPRPGADFTAQLRHSGDRSRLFAFTVLTVLQVGLGLLGWSSLFDAALNGRLERTPLIRWALLAFSVALVEIIRTFVVGRMTVSVAAHLKRRVLAGALRLDPNDIRARGSGGLLAMISEAEVLETAGFSAVVSFISAIVSIACAALVLGRGVGGAYHVLLLFGWCGVVGAGMFVLSTRTRRWVDFRVAMTNRLVERMVGHRTRLTQQPPAQRHTDEDAELELYLADSASLDRVVRLIQSLPSRGWLLIGFLSLLPILWRGDVDVRPLLITIAGLFLGQSAFGDVASSVGGMLNLSVAWGRVGELFRAAARPDPHGLPAAAVQEVDTMRRDANVEDTVVDSLDGLRMIDGESSVLEARRVTFRYGATGEPVLRAVDLRVHDGERILIEGKSGGGKSTLAGLLAGLRDPDSGLVLHHGMDRATLGTATWRRRVASVPQFHENHILSSSLLFNLLLGRKWPPGPGDRELAESVCRSLGLGPVLERMPAGLEQIVGETGWQLSHGERTRVFLARALLQGAEVVLVDESFGALDPHTLRVAIDATWAQARTLIVIAHP